MRVLLVTLVAVVILGAGCITDSADGPPGTVGGSGSAGLHADHEDNGTSGAGGQDSMPHEEALVDEAPHGIIVDPIGSSWGGSIQGMLQVRIDDGPWSSPDQAHLTTDEGTIDHDGTGLLRLPVPVDGHTFQVRFLPDDDVAYRGDWYGLTGRTTWSLGDVRNITLEAPGAFHVNLQLSGEDGSWGHWEITGSWSATWTVEGTVADDLPATGATAHRILVPGDDLQRVTLETEATANGTTGLGRTLVLSALLNGYAECRGGDPLPIDQDDTDHYLDLDVPERGATEVWVGAPSQYCYRDLTRANLEPVPYRLRVSVEPLTYGYWY